MTATLDSIYLPTVQGFPGQSRDFALCPGVQGFTPFVQGCLVDANLLCLDFSIPNSGCLYIIHIGLCKLPAIIHYLSIPWRYITLYQQFDCRILCRYWICKWPRAWKRFGCPGKSGCPSRDLKDIGWQVCIRHSGLFVYTLLVIIYNII